MAARTASSLLALLILVALSLASPAPTRWLLETGHPVLGHEEEAGIDPSDIRAAAKDPIQKRLGGHARGSSIFVHLPGASKAQRGPGRGSMYGFGTLAYEPTLGITPDGTIYAKGYSATRESPVMASSDQGRTWADVSSLLPDGRRVHSQGVDPFLYVDEATGRIFDSDFLGCTLLSFRDWDKESWSHSFPCSLTDHQSIFTGPPATSTTTGYPNVVYYCAIDGGALCCFATMTSCMKSLNGGVTFVRTGGPAFTNDPSAGPANLGIPGHCGGASGHGFADNDGVVYMPRGYCGEPWLAMSDDEGLTWTRVQVADNGMPEGPGCYLLEGDVEGFCGPVTEDFPAQEHEAAVVADGAGNVFYFYMARNRLPYLARSHDGGATWADPVMVGPPDLKEAALPSIDIASRSNGIAIAYIGSTDAPGGSAPIGNGDDYLDTTWHGYLAVIPTPTAVRPKIYTATISPSNDPLQMHGCGIVRCNQQFDFIDVVIAPNGFPWMVAVDACDSNGDCARIGQGVAGTLRGAPRLN